MNKLAGQQKGFSLGSTVQSHTKGIWMWCVPHPKKPNHTLVLLDTEGLGDVEKKQCQNQGLEYVGLIRDEGHCTFTPFFLSLLLSYVTELTDKIRAKSSPDANEVEDSADFVSFFPDFVWTLRDFSLELEVRGQPISADEYLENSLKLKQGLETLVLTYVDAISSGDMPCMENAVLALAQIENSAAVQKAIAHYDQQMAEKVQLPTETLQELLDLHMASEKEAIEVFMKNSFKDVDHLFQKELGSAEVLHAYLSSKESVIDAILQTDQTLTEKEKEIEVQRVKAESAEAAAKMLEEMQKKNQQMMEEKERSYQEHVKQLTEKMEQERAQLMAEQERVLALKLQEQAKLLKEGFQNESRQLQKEIENLKNNMKNSSGGGCILI
ncbi:Interferon-induced guanylate-binding protein 1 [Myotis davidii]|uniref:Interferon-induced guanylate-binding protein 1 n=2 Tax=Myotis davidii TaxID=225400 RepID=L5LJ21_MYODS|nr:Interferon-induced guanylate-binding protein 1 [Myotis davidii]